ncbi:hypothetical protein [Streptomyces sp. enrichment culture]|uniref:hypothetical protein n=1 Tax=Streptomyces sp. enrichment culture TaxID=1795815 RepID=UPI003F56B918
MTPRPHARRAVAPGSLLLPSLLASVLVLGFHAPAAHADSAPARPRMTAAGGAAGPVAPGPGDTAPAPSPSAPVASPPQDGTPTGTPTGGTSGAPADPSPGASAPAPGEGGTPGDPGPGPGPGGPEATSAAPGPTLRPSPSFAGRPAGAGVRRPGRSAPPSPSASATPEPSASPDGEDPARSSTATDDGRLDGRFDGQGPVPDPRERDAQGAVRPSDSPSGAAWEPHGRAAETGVDRRVSVLTLGIGLTLMGLGIGFLGVRVRRV